MKKTSLGELIANAVSHGVGALLSIAGLVILLVIADTTSEIVAGIIYGTSLIILYFSSTLLYLSEKSTGHLLNIIPILCF